MLIATNAELSIVFRLARLSSSYKHVFIAQGSLVQNL
jgi:hypothetical protein